MIELKVKTKVARIGVSERKQCIVLQPYDITILDEISKVTDKTNLWFTVETEGKSKNINAYMWKLCRLISEHPQVKMSDVEVYQDAVLNAGCNNWFDGEVKKEDFETFCKSFTKNQAGWFVAHYAHTANDMVKYRAYYGSSVFTMDQMNRLVDYLVKEAESYSIPTLESERIERLLEEWNIA